MTTRLAFAVLAFQLCACGPMSAPVSSNPPPADQSVQQQPAEGAAEPANPGQVIVDILAGQGYGCTAESDRWICQHSDSTWPFTLSYVPQQDGSTVIWFDSYLNRAFARPCSQFTFAVKDLTDEAGRFTASCDDTTKQFRLNTNVVYGSELDVMAWLNEHGRRVQRAHQQLTSINAIAIDF